MSDAEEPTASVPASDSQTSHCTVVGIGASAGGLSALKSFFQNMPTDSGMAFVVIVHLAEHHQSNLSSILQTNTSMPVIQVTETLRVEPNHVYVIPPGKYLEMIDGEIRLAERVETRGIRVPIDLFLAYACGSLRPPCDLRDSFRQRFGWHPRLAAGQGSRRHRHRSGPRRR